MPIVEVVVEVVVVEVVVVVVVVDVVVECGVECVVGVVVVVEVDDVSGTHVPHVAGQSLTGDRGFKCICIIAHNVCLSLCLATSAHVWTYLYPNSLATAPG
jgi:hypothetical protein